MGMKLPKRSKYRAVRTTIDGITFASKKEAKRYAELKALLTSGEICDLQLQPRFPIFIQGIKVCDYVADFSYLDSVKSCRVIEDAKGMKTPMYRLKKKMFEAQYRIGITEV